MRLARLGRLTQALPQAPAEHPQQGAVLRSSAAGSSPPRSDSARLAALANPARSSAAATANSVLDNWPSELESARVNVAVLLSVLTSARSRGSHADVAEWKSHSATMHTKTMISAFVVRILLLA